jgi:hypothetical protein
MVAAACPISSPRGGAPRAGGVAAVLALALYRSGRQADALAVLIRGFARLATSRHRPRSGAQQWTAAEAASRPRRRACAAPAAAGLGRRFLAVTAAVGCRTSLSSHRPSSTGGRTSGSRAVTPYVGTRGRRPRARARSRASRGADGHRPALVALVAGVPAPAAPSARSVDALSARLEKRDWLRLVWGGLTPKATAPSPRDGRVSSCCGTWRRRTAERAARGDERRGARLRSAAGARIADEAGRRRMSRRAFRTATRAVADGVPRLGRVAAEAAHLYAAVASGGKRCTDADVSTRFQHACGHKSLSRESAVEP